MASDEVETIIPIEEIVDLVLSFLEVAVHQILCVLFLRGSFKPFAHIQMPRFIRQVYPKGMTLCHILFFDMAVNHFCRDF